mmetsp:Transcript_2323/g.7584  ORF Transcript_2323/g.7584 Transcript_2323/m.7584 type:complete len:226 (-) Transcript_2323:755-1432(-)
MLATYRRSLPPAHPAKREPGRPRRQFHSWQPETLQPWRRLRRSPRRGRLLLPRLLLPRLVAAGLLAAHPRDDGVHLPPRLGSLVEHGARQRRRVLRAEGREVESRLAERVVPVARLSSSSLALSWSAAANSASSFRGSVDALVEQIPIPPRGALESGILRGRRRAPREPRKLFMSFGPRLTFDRLVVPIMRERDADGVGPRLLHEERPRTELGIAPQLRIVIPHD